MADTETDGGASVKRSRNSSPKVDEQALQLHILSVCGQYNKPKIHLESGWHSVRNEIRAVLDADAIARLQELLVEVSNREQQLK